MCQGQHFFYARLDDLAEDLAGNLPGPSSPNTRHGNDIVPGQVACCRKPEFLLDPLRLVERRAQTHRDVIGKVVATETQHRGLLDGAPFEDRDIRRAAPDIHHADPQIALVAGQNRLGRGQGFEHDIHHVESRLVAAFDDILGAGDRGGDDVDLGFQAYAAHPKGFPDPILLVDDEFLGNHVDDLAIHGDRHGLRGIDDPLDVDLPDLPVLDRNDTMAVEGPDMASGDPRVDRGDLTVRHQFRLFHGVLDGCHRGIDVDDHALSETAGRMGADSHHVYAVLGFLCNHCTNFRGADIESHDQLAIA